MTDVKHNIIMKNQISIHNILVPGKLVDSTIHDNLNHDIFHHIREIVTTYIYGRKKNHIDALPPYSESEYKCHFFTSSFELKLKMYLSLGGNKSSEFHTTAANLVYMGTRLMHRPKIMCIL